MQTRTVEVGNISDLAGEREVAEFFSFSGEIERVDIVRRDVGKLRTAFVTFKHPKALEIALLLSSGTILRFGGHLNGQIGVSVASSVSCFLSSWEIWHILKMECTLVIEYPSYGIEWEAEKGYTEYLEQYVVDGIVA